ncbi:hypothetical protein I7I51_03667 [Histoplasma capsulatum]|uniref:Uncharacterized protein n=1 Tax=Ajellomyces capsulatus TaxID=5037 RepID=A0A8A1MAH8_AJECA|nr:hypothetical protein I7I51_03667 [Histoplasma capsulatum]
MLLQERLKAPGQRLNWREWEPHVKVWMAHGFAHRLPNLVNMGVISTQLLAPGTCKLQRSLTWLIPCYMTGEGEGHGCYLLFMLKAKTTAWLWQGMVPSDQPIEALDNASWQIQSIQVTAHVLQECSLAALLQYCLTVTGA